MKILTIDEAKKIYLGAKIHEGAVILEGAVIHEDAVIHKGAVIREGAVIYKGDEGIVIHNAYRYSAGCYFDSKVNLAIIRLGCYHRTIEEWEKDFWNNLHEFTNPDAPESKDRLYAYSLCKDYAVRKGWYK